MCSKYGFCIGMSEGIMDLRLIIMLLVRMSWADVWHQTIRAKRKPSDWRRAPGISAAEGLVCWSLTSLCNSNGHIETMPAREINPFTALTRIRSQFLRTQWSTSNHQRVNKTTRQTAQPSGLAPPRKESLVAWGAAAIYGLVRFGTRNEKY